MELHRSIEKPASMSPSFPGWFIEVLCSDPDTALAVMGGVGRQSSDEPTPLETARLIDMSIG
jgi:hypothetical protein